MKVDAEIDRLYGLPLDEFVGERDALAKRLRADGDREAADRIKALRKPTAGAWALNQAVRRRGRERDDLLAAGERLREAHEGLLSGGDRAALRDAMAEQRELAATLADAAETIASETGKSGPALKERVRGTLHAAAVDEEVRAELAAGRVVREREAVGLGLAGAVAAPGGQRRSREARGGRARVPRAQRAEGEHAEQLAERGRAEQLAECERAERLATAERQLGEARSTLAEAEAAHDAAAAEVGAASHALREAKAAERDARKALRERAREVSKREREAQRLRPSHR